MKPSFKLTSAIFPKSHGVTSFMVLMFGTRQFSFQLGIALMFPSGAGTTSVKFSNFIVFLASSADIFQGS